MATNAHRVARFAVIAAGMLAAIAAPPLRAQGPEVEAIRFLVETGHSIDAWPMCESVDRIKAPQSDLWCGIAAVDIGRAAEGVLSLERYVLQHPGDPRARLELARAYFHADDDASARREFATVLAADPPPSVRISIDRYLDALDARESEYLPSVHGWIEAGGGNDSNVNAGV
ncbi:MAG: hypothetical protein IT519_05535, partial [Burkholderiales bacterium]|nr:hypothetical protein [Burkholderiales bacterium]